ncbi:MAG: site-specific DNA-methyltransferase [Deltaproteobacteria bacterium]|nr:MAG: site-specific DNA-methyltransferase [Deltaproteobacteria bacterium]
MTRWTDVSQQKWIIGDCMELLPHIPTGSVDLVISDLPYAVTKNHWDSLIPLGPLWREYKRITKGNAAIILFGQGFFTCELMMSNPDMWRYQLIWEKDRPTGFLNAAHMPLRSHEDICVFYKKTPTYNPQFWEGKPVHGMGTKFRKGGSQTSNYGDYDIANNPTAERAGDTKKYPRSVLRFPKPHPAVHPTQKPLGLIEYLILTYSNEGDMVHDSCMGSGTTMEACKNTNRNFIGFEIDGRWVNRYRGIAAQRKIGDFVSEG